MAHFNPEEYLHTVTEILTILRSTNQHEQVFSLVVDRAVRLAGCQTCAIIVVDPATEYLHIAVSDGVSHTFAKEFQRKLATGSVGRLLWTGAPVLIADSEAQPELAREIALEQPFASAVCVGMMVDNRALGYLHVDSTTAGAFTTKDICALQGLADLAGLALHKSRLFEENLHLDTVDHETGLKKYPAFLDRLQEITEHALASNEPYGLLLLDVDNYKHIALTYGADAAKQTLREIADEIRSMIRPMDLAGRYGYDECIVFRLHASPHETAAFAEELRRRIEQRPFAGQNIRTSVSIGTASFPADGTTDRDLLLVLREALYEAQRAGRNQVRSRNSQR